MGGCQGLRVEADVRQIARVAGIMSKHSDDLPVLVINGANFSDVAGFALKFSALLQDHTWRRNLDAFK